MESLVVVDALVRLEEAPHAHVGVYAGPHAGNLLADVGYICDVGTDEDSGVNQSITMGSKVGNG